jgi:uncharacterized MAPEG superfamily protein
MPPAPTHNQATTTAWIALMTIAYWCVLIAACLPLVFTGIANATGPGYDNARPRTLADADIADFRKRAYWAHLNSFEAFPPFAAAVIIASVVGAERGAIDALAVAFIGFRLAYGAFYIADWATSRSLVWIAAFGCVIGLFILAARAG